MENGTGQAIDAGTYATDWEEQRPFLHKERKGGWIELIWENDPGKFATRTIVVTRARAVQAMSRLAAGADVA